ncbi:MAG: hypothetical protein SGCHY_003526 [Lobulomycetales sp.]
MISFLRRQFQKHPFSSQLIVGGSLWVAGDLISQRLTKNKDSPYDWHRVGVMAFYGTVFASPVYYLWYKNLDKFVYKHFYRRSLYSHFYKLPNQARPTNAWELVGIKLFLDQFIFDPPMLAFFFAAIHVLENDFSSSLDRLRDKFKEEFFLTYVVDICTWLPFQAVNFRFISAAMQPVAVNAFSILWNAYLSLVSHR